ncbi:MAG: oxidoreductase, partial [Saprospiraceae bacterium]
LPNQDGFGVESKEFQALLHAEFDGVPFRGHIETATGNWNALFENMADVILRDGKMAIPLEEIVWQLEVIEQVKG